MKNTTTLFLFAACLILGAIVQAQEPEFASFGDDEIEVSEEQSERIDGLELNFFDEKAPLVEEEALLEEQLQDLKKLIASKRAAFEAAMLGILSADQRETLAARRRQRLEDEWRAQQADDIEHLKILLPILEKLRTTKSLSILEAPQRAREDTPTAPLDDASMVHVGKHVFFKDPLALSRVDEISALATASSYKSFGTYLGGKFCGGFHPDANIQLVTETDTVQILVCFGCAEAEIINGDIRMMVEVESEAYDALKELCLRNFRHRTPAVEADPAVEEN